MKKSNNKKNLNNSTWQLTLLCLCVFSFFFFCSNKVKMKIRWRNLMFFPRLNSLSIFENIWTHCTWPQPFFDVFVINHLKVLFLLIFKYIKWESSIFETKKLMFTFSSYDEWEWCWLIHVFKSISMFNHHKYSYHHISCYYYC